MSEMKYNDMHGNPMIDNGAYAFFRLRRKTFRWDQSKALFSEVDRPTNTLGPEWCGSALFINEDVRTDGDNRPLIHDRLYVDDLNRVYLWNATDDAFACLIPVEDETTTYLESKSLNMKLVVW
jgi:hypothetical protein